MPEGTLSSRLAAARKKLARRLSRHGLAFTAGTLAVLLESKAMPAVPAALAESTTRAALLMAAGQAAAVSGAVAALTEGVLKTMVFAKVKTVTVVLLGVAVLGLGTGKLYYAADPGQQGQAATAQEKADQDQDGRKLLTGGRTQQGQQPATEKERGFDRGRQLEPPERAALDRERALREVLEAARKEAAIQRARAEAALEVAEKERGRAEAQLQEARLRLQQARRAETGARQQEQGSDSVGQPSQGGRPQERPRVREAPQQSLKASAEKLRADYLARREQLQNRRKKLEEEATKQIQAEMQELEARYQLGVESLRLREAEAARQQEIRPEQGRALQPAAGDKLDRILEKLEQMERRLDRLERAGR